MNTNLRNPTTTDDVKQIKNLDWSDFKLQKNLIKGIIAKNFDCPSPIQEEVIPRILTQKSVIARAKNGTGKTAAFLIPILNCINEEIDAIQALVLVPTRELALQTASVIKQISKFMKIECMTTTGGTSLRDDILRLKKPVHIVVATPGRILDLAYKKIANLSQCKFFVLDEADKLISQEFQPIILKIIDFLPE